MQETIKVIKEALNRNSNDLYELNQKKEEAIRNLVYLQTEIYQKEDSNAKLSNELRQLRNSQSEITDSESLKGANLRQADAMQRPVYNDNCEKEKLRG